MSFRTIDTHGHVAAPDVGALVLDEPGFQRQRAADASAMGRVALDGNALTVGHELTSAEARLGWMDRSGVGVQVVAPLPSPHHGADRGLAARIAEQTDVAVVAHGAAAPGRLVGVGTVPLQHPDVAIRQLVETAGADRVVLGSDYPFDMGVHNPVERLLAAGLSDDDVTSIRGRNAASPVRPRRSLTRAT